MAEFKDVPLTSSKNAERRFGAKEWIALAGESFDEGGFAAAVWAENGNVFAGFDRESEPI